ncbi:hypothetical protein [Streptomyces sp. WM6386]|uniref:hypothetical protein n=1 Tax=Streptomyces sp. WM6386 TaxID=1415558 RepID=UPI0006190A3E|nr:hypothetical protein [Streptomyces sp. WM6386]KKD02924.1 hypothetical protein TN53_37885 [Streptomyces sp. WM6386]
MTHRRKATSAAFYACAVAAALVLTACSDSGSAPAPTPELGPAELALLTRSGGQALDEARLFHAETELIAACMTAKGFPYRVDAFAPATGSYEEREIGLDTRRREGYGLYARFSAERARKTADTDGPTNDQYVARLPAGEADAYLRALRGTPGDLREIRFGAGSTVTFSAVGCEADSRRRLFGDLDGWAAAMHIPQNLDASLTDQVTRAPRYTAALRDWRTCMREKGHPYPTPEEASERLSAEFRNRGATEELRRREIAVAVGDGECAARLHIPSTVLSLRKQYAASLPVADKSRLHKVAEIWSRAVARARAVSPTVRSHSTTDG